MSIRSQVHMINTGVYLYQHMDGYNLAEEVQIALKKKERWDDPEYLTRIIFATMLKENNAVDGTLSYGIGTEEHGDIEYLVNVNTLSQRIIVLNKRYGQGWKTLLDEPFEEYIKMDVSAQKLGVCFN